MKKGTASRTVQISGSLSQRVLLTDDRQNPGCRYSRDRMGRELEPIDACSLRVRRCQFFAYVMSSNGLIVWTEIGAPRERGRGPAS